jgi:hypothetical protein
MGYLNRLSLVGRGKIAAAALGAMLVVTGASNESRADAFYCISLRKPSLHTVNNPESLCSTLSSCASASKLGNALACGTYDESLVTTLCKCSNQPKSTNTLVEIGPAISLEAATQKYNHYKQAKEEYETEMPADEVIGPRTKSKDVGKTIEENQESDRRAASRGGKQDPNLPPPSVTRKGSTTEVGPPSVTRKGSPYEIDAVSGQTPDGGVPSVTRKEAVPEIDAISGQTPDGGVPSVTRKETAPEIDAISGQTPEMPLASVTRDKSLSGGAPETAKLQESTQKHGKTAATGPEAFGPLPEVELSQRKDDEKFDRRAVANEGDSDCAYSSGVDAKYSCRGTRTLIEGARLSNTITQVGGSVATSFAGQSAQRQAMEQGTQSAALRGAASTQRTAGQIQVVSGALNTVMGVVQMQRNLKHGGSGKAFNQAMNAQVVGDVGLSGDGRSSGSQGYVSSTNSLAQKIIESGDGMNNRSRALNNATDAYSMAMRQKAFDEKKSDIKRDVKFIGRQASQEQAMMAHDAGAGGMTSLATGMVQMISGGFNMKGAGQLEDAARKLDKLANLAPTPTFVPLAPSDLRPGDALAPGSGQSLNPGTSTQTAAGEQTDEPVPDFGKPWGDPIGKLQDTDPAPGPTGGGFTASAPPGGGSQGGGGGGVGGASTSPATGGESEPVAKMADQGRTPNYESGGGTFGAAGGGGGVGADRGPDLSGLLAQFLPKQGDVSDEGIKRMDFGGRGLASAEGPISLLDRNANIFERVHETYQEKNRRGRIGL